MISRAGSFAAVCSLVLAGSVLRHPQEEVYSFERTYVTGEVDRYRVHLTFEGAFSGEISTRVIQTVKKTYPNGDADVETRSLGGEMLVMNQSGTVPESPAQTVRVNRSGAPADPKGKTQASIMNPMQYASYIAKSGLKVGQELKVEDKSPDGTVTGKLKLTEVKDGRAQLTGAMDFTTKDVPNPVHIEIKSTVALNTKKQVETSGVLTGLPKSNELPPIDRLIFKITRERD